MGAAVGTVLQLWWFWECGFAAERVSGMGCRGELEGQSPHRPPGGCKGRKLQYVAPTTQPCASSVPDHLSMCPPCLGTEKEKLVASVWLSQCGLADGVPRICKVSG